MWVSSAPRASGAVNLGRGRRTQQVQVHICSSPVVTNCSEQRAVGSDYIIAPHQKVRRLSGGVRVWAFRRPQPPTDGRVHAHTAYFHRVRRSHGGVLSDERPETRWWW